MSEVMWISCSSPDQSKMTEKKSLIPGPHMFLNILFLRLPSHLLVSVVNLLKISDLFFFWIGVSPKLTHGLTVYFVGTRVNVSHTSLQNKEFLRDSLLTTQARPAFHSNPSKKPCLNRHSPPMSPRSLPPPRYSSNFPFPSRLLNSQTHSL